jgi:hypothetical protein
VELSFGLNWISLMKWVNQPDENLPFPDLFQVSNTV